jgi:hypothetical protein
MRIEEIVISGVLSIASVTAVCDTLTGNHTFSLYSHVFKDGEMIPKLYTSTSAPSPPLYWVNPPKGSLSFALIMEDVISPLFGITHWVLYNIPSDNLELHEGLEPQKLLKNGCIQGKNFFRQNGYLGPNPLWGRHCYVFTLYALDMGFDTSAVLSKAKLRKRMKNHIIAQTRIKGYCFKTKGDK